MTAVGQDANNHLFPIAYAIVDSETRDNWKFFLELLHEDLGDYKIHDWNFMSDQQKVKKVDLYFAFYIFLKFAIYEIVDFVLYVILGSYSSHAGSYARGSP